MFLTTVTGGQLINQSGGYIYTPPQYIGADFDEDGIPDLVELYGLLPNGELLETSPYETDSDFDGIPDNEEFNYVHSFLTPDVTLAEYINAIKANSFPGVSDSDGDYDPDSVDSQPYQYQLNNNFIHQSEKLENLAAQYNDGTWDVTSKYEVDKK